MILIFSEASDTITFKVTQWLAYYGIPFLRINKEDANRLKTQVIGEGGKTTISFSFENQIYSLDQFTYTWYRRGALASKFPHYFGNFKIPESFKSALQAHFTQEINTVNDLFYFINANNSLNHPIDYSLNKLIVLDQAMKCGLKVPPFLITGSKEKLIQFKEKQGSIISKTIQDNLVLKGPQYESSHYTYRITDEIIEEIPNTFPNSFFQKEIKKKYELRIFFLKGTLFSIAHFNATNNPVDGKHIQKANGQLNRLTVFKLPGEETRQICDLMRMVNLNSGSIDMIVSSDLEFYFLEVNPVGQFSFLNNISNYHIDLEIAKQLSNQHYEIY